MTGRALIVTPDWLLATALRLTLQAEGWTVAGIAHTEDRAVDLARAHRPEVAVSNLQLVRGDGVAAARRYAPETGCVPLFLAVHPERLRRLRPPPCLFTTATAISGAALLAATTVARHWHQHGRPPAPLPPRLAAITTATPEAGLEPRAGQETRSTPR